MVMLQGWLVYWEGAWSCYRGGQLNREQNSQLTEVASLMEGEWSCYRGGH